MELGDVPWLLNRSKGSCHLWYVLELGDVPRLLNRNYAAVPFHAFWNRAMCQGY